MATNTKETKDSVPTTTRGNLAVQSQTSVAMTPTYDPKYLESLPSKNAMVRYLNSRGLTKGQIVKVSATTPKMQYKDGRAMLFQHVRNILITPLSSDTKE